MKRIITLMVVLFACLAISTGSAQEKNEPIQVLTGKIGRHKVVMHLNLNHFTIGETVGYYIYKSNPQNRFNLVVKDYETINAKGSMIVVLYEYTDKGVHSGTFKGQYECRGDYYEGVFTNSKGKKYKFILE
ncbi:MAG: hypothetical protein IKW83_00570 [Muribaculaceae bacterium]|nr:hypothetical protein [Muribaculaceae bacterium]